MQVWGRNGLIAATWATQLVAGGHSEHRCQGRQPQLSPLSCHSQLLVVAARHQAVAVGEPGCAGDLQMEVGEGP